jgi:thioredoxin reductase (NADPH)
MTEQPDIVIVGHPADPRVRALADVAERSGRSRAIHQIGSASGDHALRAAGQDGSVLPVVRVRDGAVLIAPTDLDLIEEFGFPRAPAHSECELAVVGAGLAGLAAAVAGAVDGWATLVVDPTVPGGSVERQLEIPDYLGFPGGLSGADLIDRAVEQARRAGVRFLLTERVEQILDRGNSLHLLLTSGATVGCRAVVVATGGHRWPAVELSLPGVFVAQSTADGGPAVAVGAGAEASRQAVRYLSESAPA